MFRYIYSRLSTYIKPNNFSIYIVYEGFRGRIYTGELFRIRL